MGNGFESYHGVVLCRIIHKNQHASIKLYSSKSNSSYVVNGEIGVYVKYCTKRMSPWDFTFMKSHCDEIFQMMQNVKSFFLVLVCGSDGIACLDCNETKIVLSDSLDKPQGVHVARGHREKYRVSSGKDGKLKFKIGDNQFPGQIFGEKR